MLLSVQKQEMVIYMGSYDWGIVHAELQLPAKDIDNRLCPESGPLACEAQLSHMFRSNCECMVLTGHTTAVVLVAGMDGWGATVSMKDSSLKLMSTKCCQMLGWG